MTKAGCDNVSQCRHFLNLSLTLHRTPPQHHARAPHPALWRKCPICHAYSLLWGPSLRGVRVARAVWRTGQYALHNYRRKQRFAKQHEDLGSLRQRGGKVSISPLNPPGQKRPQQHFCPELLKNSDYGNNNLWERLKLLVYSTSRF